MKELFDKWAESKRKRQDDVPSDSANKKKLTEEIQILEKLLTEGFFQIPGETKDVRSLLEDRQKKLRDMKKE